MNTPHLKGTCTPYSFDQLADRFLSGAVSNDQLTQAQRERIHVILIGREIQKIHQTLRRAS